MIYVSCGDMCVCCMVCVWCPVNERCVTCVYRCVRDMNGVKTVNLMCYEIKIGLLLPWWNMKCGCNSGI